jgi:hypothetical protein
MLELKIDLYKTLDKMNIKLTKFETGYDIVKYLVTATFLTIVTV